MAEYKVDFQETIEKAFLDYSGFVIQNRALVDVRDGLKYGARQLLYAQLLKGITHKKKFQKATKSVSAALEVAYVHGDASAYGTLVRMAKPFAMRYPLQDAQGSFGTPAATDNHSAMRYLEIRMSELGGRLFDSLDKKTIEKWYWNYDDTEQLPTVLPSPAFYNLVNGSSGIAVGLSTSLCQHNIVEVNNALIALLKDEHTPFEQIYCAPDFATGATLINGDEVKESLRVGHGKACCLRATIEYEPKKHQLIVSEMPYGVYTDTVSTQLARLMEEEPSCGIEKFIDATTDKPDIRITLKRTAVPDKVKNLLYKHTSLQSHYTINMYMLDQGKVPKLFGWKEALLAHIAHAREVVLREVEFDLEKSKARLHIVEGLLLAIEHIDAFIKIIRGANSTKEASQQIMEQYGLSEEQAKAILAITLSRLVNLEYVKVEKEKHSLLETIEQLEEKKTNPQLRDADLIERIEAITKQFGDARRTKIINIAKTLEDDEVLVVQPEEEEVVISVANSGSVHLAPTNVRVRPPAFSPKDKVVATLRGSNIGRIVLFTKSGTAVGGSITDWKSGQSSLSSIYDLPVNEKIETAALLEDPEKVVATFTTNGMVKVSLLREFAKATRRPIQAIKLKDGDNVAAIVVADKDSEIAIATKKGKVLRYSLSTISTTGRATLGVRAISLKKDDEVIDVAVLAPGAQELILYTKDRVMREPLSELPSGARTTQGKTYLRSDLTSTITQISIE